MKKRKNSYIVYATTGTGTRLARIVVEGHETRDETDRRLAAALKAGAPNDFMMWVAGGHKREFVF